ncbi:hypothetical protein K439DRAFT_1135415 [Ramaria rubella]|nr:hypothetical protein K439DRAFT_1135415 [Ramaria rubella]
MREQIAKVHNRWKVATGGVVISAYLLTGTRDEIKERAAYLLESVRFLYKRLVVPRGPSKERRMNPFGHEAIQAVIVSAGFAAKDSVARLQSKILNPMPLEIIAFASMAIHNALAEFVELGIRKNVNMDANVYASKYRTYLKHVHTFSTSAKQVNCLDLQQSLYTAGMDKLEQNLDSSGSEEMFTLGDSSPAQSVA